ncbi:MAG: adenylate kinase family protein [Candidatus Saccharimonadales bacterium]
MGIAGSGKGTQGKLLAEAQGYQVLSTGELLRNYGSDEQHARMKTGELISDEEITDLLDKTLNSLKDQNRIILDGYPRSVAQSQWLLDQVAAGRFSIQYVLHLQASREAVTARMHERARADDHERAIEARFKEYEQTTVPILDYYRNHDIEVVEVNGEQPIEAVHKEIIAIDKAHCQV